MALTTTELSQVKFWLGYGNLTVLARPYFDIAAVFETVVQNNLDAWGEGYVRSTILANLTQLDSDVMAARLRLAADAVKDVQRNKTEVRDLLALQNVWVDRLAQVTKVPRAPKLGAAVTEVG